MLCFSIVSKETFCFKGIWRRFVGYLELPAASVFIPYYIAFSSEKNWSLLDLLHHNMCHLLQHNHMYPEIHRNNNGSWGL